MKINGYFILDGEVKSFHVTDPKRGLDNVLFERARPHGVWKEVCDFDGNHYKWECSVCGRLEEFVEDFCNCGADMRKEGDNK